MASPPPLPTPQRITGLSFAPEDDQLITLYLGPKIAGQPLPASTSDFIHEADVYAADPATLCADFRPASSGIEESSNIWYFFTSPRAKNRRGSRKSRTVGEGKGTWHAEIRKDVFDGKDRFVGYRRTFSHVTSSGERSGWLMMEFRFGGNQEQEQESVAVVCKIYKTPRTGKGGCSASARKKRKAKHDPAAPSAPVRRRLQFRSPPASNPPPATTEFPQQDFLNESVKQHSEVEESTPAFDPIAFLASGHALSALNFYDTTVRRQLQFRSPPASNPATEFPEQDFLNEPVKRHSQTEESTAAFDPIAFLAGGHAQSCSWTTGTPVLSGMDFVETDRAGFALSCPGTTVLPTVADWASQAAPEHYSKISYGSCTSGTEFLQSLPVTGFRHDASFSWSAQPISAPTASWSASTPLRSCVEPWASPMLPSLQRGGWMSLC